MMTLSERSTTMRAATTPGHPLVDAHAASRIEPLAVPGPAGEPPPPDADVADAWFRAEFDADDVVPGEEVALRFGGLATLVDVELNGEPILHSDSMFVAHEVDVRSLLRRRNVLVMRCRALAPELEIVRRPRARWRTRLVADNRLRWIRTTILGRAPGFAPGPPMVGPWRPVWLERRRVVAVDDLSLRTSLDGHDGIDGVLTVTAVLRPLGGPSGVADTARITEASVSLEGPTGTHRADLELHPAADGLLATTTLRVPRVARWWPHTHGGPTLYDVHLDLRVDDQAVAIDAGRVGFRSLDAGQGADRDLERDGLALTVNGRPIFARGAVWTPLPSSADAADLRRTLEAVVAAGMNMLRIPGIGAYESEAFHDACDELGIMVWQDAAFANMDYPFTDPAFLASCEIELRQLLHRLAGRPSTVVLCGNSEIEQQAAMLGLPAEVWRAPFFETRLPELVQEAGADLVVLPSAPFGGARPFQTDRGVANYYGVGGYRRPVHDARLAGVRFAAESLAFANVPDDDTIARMLPGAPADSILDHPVWKAAVPRDAGSDWDFEDVRDHYLGARFGVDPSRLRLDEPERYLELSRAVTGELMAEVFGEWRRSDSPCAGALVLWLRDRVPGAGWGVLDDQGMPKVAYHHLRRALAPTAVWMTDEGLSGIAIHVANDGPDRFDGRLRVALYGAGGQSVADGRLGISVGPGGLISHDVESMIGRFADASWAYRFGPPSHDVIIATLECDTDDGPVVVSQSARYPAVRTVEIRPGDRLGLVGRAVTMGDGSLSVTVASAEVADGVRIHAQGYRGDDDAFVVEPGHPRLIRLRPDPGTGAAPDANAIQPEIALTALNLDGRVAVAVEVVP